MFKNYIYGYNFKHLDYFRKEVDMLKYIDLANIKLDMKLANLVPEEIARENCILVLKKVEDKIYVVTDRSPNFQLEEKLKFMTKKNIVFLKSERIHILKFIDNLYCREKLDYAINDIESANKRLPIGESAGFMNSPVVRTANYIIQKAIDERASDIHIEPFENDINIRFRIDGVICNYIKIPKDVYSFICTRIKIMADINIAEKRIPQDGKIGFTKGEEKYDIRVSTLPTIYGEKIVLRILYKNRGILNLEDLGFLKEDALKISKMVRYTSGLILAIGPTGAGKSSTLYALLDNLDKEQKNIVSIEDPVEYAIEGVNQVNVNNKIGLNFATGLKSVLRQDPDVIMVGEIRDEETAKIAVKAAITGHLVLSTLHTNSAQEAVFRLESMGVQSYFIKDALIGVISQRLVRKLCTNCKKVYAKKNNAQVYYTNGCFKCNYTGYFGRTVVYEISSMRDKNLNSNTILNNSKALINRGITNRSEIIRIGI